MTVKQLRKILEYYPEYAKVNIVTDGMIETLFDDTIYIGEDSHDNKIVYLDAYNNFYKEKFKGVSLTTTICE